MGSIFSKTFGLCCLLLATNVLADSAQSVPAQDAVLGEWMVNTGDAVIRIYEENGVYSGKVVWAGRESTDWWFENAPLLIPWHDRKAARQLKHAPSLGVDIMTGLQFNGDDKWVDGRVFNVLNGKIYGCQLSLDGPDVLKLKGYIGVPLLGASVEWHRLNGADRANMPSFPNRFEFPDSWP